MEGDQRIRIGTVAAAVVKQFMEPGVQVFDLIGIFARLLFAFNVEALQVQDLLHFTQYIVSDAGGGPLCGQPLQLKADLVDIQHILPGDADDHQTVSGVLQNALLLQAADGFPDGGAADAQLAGQPQLAQNLALRVFTGQNIPFQLFENLIGDGNGLVISHHGGFLLNGGASARRRTVLRFFLPVLHWKGRWCGLRHTVRPPRLSAFPPVRHAC